MGCGYGNGGPAGSKRPATPNASNAGGGVAGSRRKPCERSPRRRGFDHLSPLRSELTGLARVGIPGQARSERTLWIGQDRPHQAAALRTGRAHYGNDLFSVILSPVGRILPRWPRWHPSGCACHALSVRTGRVGSHLPVASGRRSVGTCSGHTGANGRALLDMVLTRPVDARVRDRIKVADSATYASAVLYDGLGRHDAAWQVFTAQFHSWATRLRAESESHSDDHVSRHSGRR
jgi:hypothetical protein